MFLQMWRIIHKKEDEDDRLYLPEEYRDPLPIPAEESETALVLPYADNPLDEESVGALVYMQIIQNAKRYVYITTPYLIIDDQMLGALTLAAKSGVDVRIITPHKWDKRTVHAITRSYYYALWESGVKIYEYTPGFVHAKVVVSDDEKAVVGTINMDYRSLYHHFECATYLYKTSCIPDIEEDFQNTLAKCRPVTPESIKNEKFGYKLRGILMKFISPLM